MAPLSSDLKGPFRKVIAFGPFRLFVFERRLERHEIPISLGSRAFEILKILIECTPEIVSKRDLIARVWPDVTVDEGTLRVHIAALRKALSDKQYNARIANVSGRGYCFIAPDAQVFDYTTVDERMQSAEGYFLPAATKMVGRERALALLNEELMTRRFVTIVGPGGVGKTTLAVSIAHRLRDEFHGSVSFADLGSIRNPAHIPNLLGTSLGLPIESDQPVSALRTFLSDKRLLLILDNCEHLIEAVSGVVEFLFREAINVHILATSREALRVEGEYVHRLRPLECPPEPSSANTALTFPAVQLLMERIAATGFPLETTEAHTNLLGEMCRKLDGVPLALELAAGKVVAYGLRETAMLIDGKFKLLLEGRRTALPRHRTLGAMLDWSFDLLPEVSRKCLCRLAVFASPFSLDAAKFVVASPDVDADQATKAIADLVAKSMLIMDCKERSYFRLLVATRDYAYGKLIESGEECATLKRHAHYYSRYPSRSAPDSRQSMQPACDQQSSHIELALDRNHSSGEDIEAG